MKQTSILMVYLLTLSGPAFENNEEVRRGVQCTCRKDSASDPAIVHIKLYFQTSSFRSTWPLGGVDSVMRQLEQH